MARICDNSARVHMVLGAPPLCLRSPAALMEPRAVRHLRHLLDLVTKVGHHAVRQRRASECKPPKALQMSIQQMGRRGGTMTGDSRHAAPGGMAANRHSTPSQLRTHLLDRKFVELRGVD